MSFMFYGSAGVNSFVERDEIEDTVEMTPCFYDWVENLIIDAHQILNFAYSWFIILI